MDTVWVISTIAIIMVAVIAWRSSDIPSRRARRPRKGGGSSSE